MGRQVVELDDRLVEAAQALADRQGVTLSAVVAQAIREYVEAVGPPTGQPSLIGLIDVPAAWTQDEIDQDLISGAHPREGWSHDADALSGAPSYTGSSRA